MNLEFVIQELLHTKNFITIPGFGSFVSKYHAARIIKSDYVKFIPPQKTVAFNSSIVTDDGVLTSFLATEYKLSPTDAKREIEQFVNRTQEILQQNKLWNFGGVGTFYYNAEQSLCFEANDPVQSTTEAFGLSDFTVHMLPKENPIEDFVSKKKIDTPLHKKILKTVFIASPIILGALLIPGILHTPQLTGFASLFRDTDVMVDFSIPPKPIPLMQHKENTTDVMDTPIIDTQKVLASNTVKPAKERKKKKEKVATTNNIFVPKSELPKVTTTKTYTQKTTPQKTYTTNSNYKFYIIVGSFGTLQFAERLQNILNQKSYNAGILTEDNKIRVYITATQTKDDAIKKLQDIKLNSEYNSAWIYSKKSDI